MLIDLYNSEKLDDHAVYDNSNYWPTGLHLSQDL